MVRIFVSQPLQASGSGSSARYGRRATRRQRRFATVGRNLTRPPTLEGGRFHSSAGQRQGTSGA
jgi:hypothetical protein